MIPPSQPAPSQSPSTTPTPTPTPSPSPTLPPGPVFGPTWGQWAESQLHQGYVDFIAGQNPQALLADILYDPFVPDYQAVSDGELLTHYQVTLIGGDWIYQMKKEGFFTGFSGNKRSLADLRGAADDDNSTLSSSPLVTNTLIWAESAYKWEPQPGNSRRLALQWTFRSDWLPLPLDWEPVFHPALAGDYIYIPGEYSSINKVDKVTG